MSSLIDLQSPTNLPQADATIKLLVFSVGKLTLALPILQVQKVIRQDTIHGSGLSHVNLAHLADTEIAVIDLHQKLFGMSEPKPTSSGYFIISKKIAKEALGIMVNQSPSLIDLTASQIRLIPESYRQADTLEIASHVALVPQEDSTQTIFILDLQRLI